MVSFSALARYEMFNDGCSDIASHYLLLMSPELRFCYAFATSYVVHCSAHRRGETAPRSRPTKNPWTSVAYQLDSIETETDHEQIDVH